MQERQANKPVKLNLDVSNKYLPQDSAFFLLNNERNLIFKNTIGKNTPMPSNYQACDMYPMPGEPNSVGSHRDQNTNEVYSWTLVDGGINYIKRINGDGTCEVVYSPPDDSNDCLPLSADPKHAIRQWRAGLDYEKLCAHRHGKALIWVDGLNDIGMIDVEASIATDYFTTPFFDLCPDPCAYTKMCVPLICTKLEGEFVTLEAGEVDLANHLLDVAIQVCYRHIYYDGRVSEWMGVSKTYYQDSRSCFDVSEGYPRCLKFRMPIGNPLVDRIEVAVRRDNELFTDGLSPLWRSVEVIEKYQPYSTQSQMWYERELADLPNFSEDDCAFDYIFCNDKECNPIDPNETNRVYNPQPVQPQGLLRLNELWGFYNYKKGNCPISGTEAKKFEISLNCENPDNCVEEFATVKVRLVVHNPLMNRNGLVFRLGGNLGDADNPDDAWAIFGHNILAREMQQQFAPEVRNFIPYIDGTTTWGQMKQWQSSPYFVNPKEVGIVAGMGLGSVRDIVYGSIDNGNFYYQEYEFKVKKGTRGFIRIASHTADNGLPLQGQDTSTFVFGTIPNLNQYHGTIVINDIITYSKEEIYFDTCSGDVTLDETFVVADQLRIFEEGYHSSCAYAGYLTDANNVPIEGAEIWENGLSRVRTDHNGFYHFSLFGDGNVRTIIVSVKVETDCGAGFNSIKNVTINGNYGQLAIADIQVTDVDFPNYKNGYYEIVTIPVKDCDNVAVGGVRVSLSGSKYQITDAVTGIATFHVRNYSTRGRVVRGVVMDLNGCFSLDCSNACNPCMPITDLTALPACFIYPPNTTNVPTTTNLNKISALINKRGLKAGGRYPFGFVVYGGCSKLSAVYPVTMLSGSLEMLDNYINIPKTQEKNVLSFCSFDYDATGMVFPDWATCLKIVRGENVNRYELQWVVDKIERTSDRKIKLTIQSLNDYNASFNFETNTLYQYLKGDRVEFINNGDGDIFDTATFGLLNYQILSPFNAYVVDGEAEAPAQYFNEILIEDDGNLDDLTVGAKIEIQRPRNCTVEPTYYEVHSIPIIEMSGVRVLAAPTGSFTTFDTFIVNRQLGNTILQQFEHHSPSDHWGSRINDGGKVHFVNRFENEKRFGRNISFSSATHINVFGYLEKTFDSPEHGDITSMGIYDNKTILIISEHDNAIAQVADNFLRVNNDGVVIASQPDTIISDAQSKISGIFGCQYPHIGSVIYGDGFVNYWDVNNSAWVQHDFNTATDVSMGKAKLYFDKRGQFIETFNKTAATDREKFRIITGWNTLTKAVIITVKSLVQGGTYNHKEAFGQTNDTLLYHPDTGDFLTFAGFVGEEYSNLDLYDGNGCSFISFLNGLPFIHPKIALSDNDYNEFFGVPTDWVIGIALNVPSEKIKIPVSYEISATQKWFVKTVKTDRPTFLSEVPISRVSPKEDIEPRDNKCNASFLFDINSRGGLFGTDKSTAGTQASGYFISVTFLRDNTILKQYDTENPTKMTKFGELDFILFKYSIVEQSGFTLNL